jgi:hypothetical protein
MSRIQTKAWNRVLFACCLLPVAATAWMLLHYATNIPKWDDYDILTFFLKWQKRQGIGETSDLLFTQVNEHRSVWHKLVLLTTTLFTGQVNFRTLIWIGDFGLVLLCAMLAWSQREALHRGWMALPIFLLTLQPQHHENLLLSEGAMANHFVMVFSLLTLLLIAQGGKRAFVLGLCSVVLCTYTNANGMITFAPLFAHLALQRQWKRLGISAVVATLTLGWYFKGYEQPPAHPSMLDSLLKYPVETLLHYLSFTGSFLQISNTFAMVTGALLSIALGVLLFRFKLHRHHPALFYFLCFLHFTAMVTALGRAGFGHEQAFAPRYKVYSVLIAACTLLAFLRLADSKRWFIGLWSASMAGIAAFLFWAWTQPFAAMDAEKATCTQGFTAWLQRNPDLQFHEGMDNSGLFYYVDDYKDKPFRTLPDALAAGIYSLPDSTQYTVLP